MKNLLLRACVAVRTPSTEFHVVVWQITVGEKNSIKKACRTCRTITFPHSTNHIIDSWRYRCG